MTAPLLLFRPIRISLPSLMLSSRAETSVFSDRRVSGIWSSNNRFLTRTPSSSSSSCRCCRRHRRRRRRHCLLATLPRAHTPFAFTPLARRKQACNIDRPRGYLFARLRDGRERGREQRKRERTVRGERGVGVERWRLDEGARGLYIKPLCNYI